MALFTLATVAAVIASAAKQSRARDEILDCFVASLLAMTGLRHEFSCGRQAALCLCGATEALPHGGGARIFPVGAHARVPKVWAARRGIYFVRAAL